MCLLAEHFEIADGLDPCWLPHGLKASEYKVTGTS